MTSTSHNVASGIDMLEQKRRLATRNLDEEATRINRALASGDFELVAKHAVLVQKEAARIDAFC